MILGISAIGKGYIYMIPRVVYYAVLSVWVGGIFCHAGIGVFGFLVHGVGGDRDKYRPEQKTTFFRIYPLGCVCAF